MVKVSNWTKGFQTPKTLILAISSLHACVIRLTWLVRSVGSTNKGLEPKFHALMEIKPQSSLWGRLSWGMGHRVLHTHTQITPNDVRWAQIVVIWVQIVVKIMQIYNDNENDEKELSHKSVFGFGRSENYEDPNSNRTWKFSFDSISVSKSSNSESIIL